MPVPTQPSRQLADNRGEKARRHGCYVGHDLVHLLQVLAAAAIQIRFAITAVAEVGIQGKSIVTPPFARPSGHTRARAARAQRKVCPILNFCAPGPAAFPSAAPNSAFGPTPPLVLKWAPTAKSSLPGVSAPHWPTRGIGSCLSPDSIILICQRTPVSMRREPIASKTSAFPTDTAQTPGIS